MSDQEFREIQLSGKQLIFLFMSAVVLLVVSFLLGVSVGKGVGPGTPLSASAGTVPPADTLVAAGKDAPAPPPADLSYHRELQGQKPVSPEPTPPAASTPPPAASSTAEPAPMPPAGTGAAPPRNPSTGEVPPITPTVTASPEKAPTTPPAPAAPPAAARGAFEVQAGAFNSRPNANTLVADLKARGFAATIVAGGRGQPPHIVRVGPYATRAEADRAAAVLSEQFKGRITPSVISR